MPTSWFHFKQRMKDFLPNRVRQWLRRRGNNLPSSSWQRQPLSVRRPFPHHGLDADQPCIPFTNHLAGGEWRLLAWLEREGIEYDFVAAEELHADPSLLSSYRAVVLNTHCEYVSKEMFEGLRFFHLEEGGWLLNLSGNSMYYEVEMMEEALRYVGGFFMDTCADETQLLGVQFTRGDYGTCAPDRIVNPTHWAFAGMQLPAQLRFGERSLNQDTPDLSQEMNPSRPGDTLGLAGQGASGWETDKLSATAPKDISLIAKGMNSYGGADMIIRDPASTRGGMLSASSIVFPGCLLIDQVASQLVKNVLGRAMKGRR